MLSEELHKNEFRKVTNFKPPIISWKQSSNKFWSNVIKILTSMYRNYQKPGVIVQQDGAKPLILPLWLCGMNWFPVWWGKSVAAGRHIAIRLLWRLGAGLGRLNSSEDTSMALCMVISIAHYVVSKTPWMEIRKIYTTLFTLICSKVISGSCCVHNGTVTHMEAHS